MSLLLDALKRAEQEKLSRGDRPELQVVGGDGGASRPEAASGALELQPVVPPAAAAKPASAAAQAAQAVFQAKVGAEPPPSRRGFIYAAAATILIAVIAAAAYVWYATQALAPVKGPGAAPQPMAPPPAPVAQAQPNLPLPPVAPRAAPASGLPLAAAPTAARSRPPQAGRPGPATAEEVLETLARDGRPVRQPPLRLDRMQETPRVPEGVAAGYEALRKGDLAAARRAYQEALGRGASLDGHLGMATIEARGGDAAAAAIHYRKALELDPRNATALAGLAALAETSRPGAVEPQLREELLRTPNSAALHFALGNVLASQARWSEAQAEYFEAHRLDPANADIAHNLAVSLDHLGQARVAAGFYRRALEGAGSQPAQFDRAAVERRLAQIGN